MIDSGLDQLQLRVDAPSHLGLGCQSINYTERERRLTKLRRNSKEALLEDAAKCVKITQMFAGYGRASSPAASMTAPALASKAAAAGNDGRGGRQQVDEAKGRQEERPAAAALYDDGTGGATGGEFELQIRSDELQSTWAVKGVFTSGGFHNIDHNPSSTIATSALHGTCFRIQQHFSSGSQQTENLTDILDPAEMGRQHVKSLPPHYTTMDLDVSLPTDEVLYVPALNTNSYPHPASRPLISVIEEGYQWLERVRNLLVKENLEVEEWISWAAYYASITEATSHPPSKSYMLPLFTESPTSHTMAWHAMKVLRQTISYLNPGQTPVMVADQPLFTLAKKLQWKFPLAELGEDSFLVTLGPMHTEKMLWSVSGDWLDGSRWTTALTNSGISTSGKAQAFISVHHICRTRYMHQVSVATLYVLMKTAYDQYMEKATNDNVEASNLIPQPFDEWLKMLCASQPQADFWFKSMELDLLIRQMHEQLIDWLKNHGSVIENLDDPDTVRREQVVRPELARLVREFKGSKESDEQRHHQQYPKFQDDYKTDVLALVDAFEDMGNPFMEDSGDLLDLDESIVMPPYVGDRVKEVKNIGMKRYTEFVDKQVRSQEEAFTAPIPLTRLKKAPLSQQCNKSEVVVVKNQQAKVTQLLLAVHSGRKIDERVFSHESSPHPPSLTRKGKMYHGNKSEILDCIVPRDFDNHRPVTTPDVLDVAVLVQMLHPGSAVTIGQYFTDVFAPYILFWFERNDRVDIVWDMYSKTSLKSGTREHRGAGARRNSWQLGFLPTSGSEQAGVVHGAGQKLEAHDTSTATVAGHRRVIVRSSHSDVVLAIATFMALGQKIDELWIAFGVRRHFRYIAAHAIAHSLGPSKAMALPAFHALTGCDTSFGILWQRQEDSPCLSSPYHFSCSLAQPPPLR
ncbi:hypothetical protein ABVT39_022389 [Epinephelus coioides]